jgi:membrane protein DedA with SNARE-associated domain
MQFVLDWITRYGYAGIFSLLVLGIVGLPIPDETLLTFAGYLVSRGKLRLVPTAAAALAGTMCGITISYLLGRLTGYFLLEKHGAWLHIRMEQVERVHGWFRRMGRFTLTVGYFVPGVRHLTAYVAGASELEAPIFAVFAYSGAVLWCATFLTLGYFLGEHWMQASAQVHRWILIGGVALAAAGAGYLLWRRRARSGSTRS